MRDVELPSISHPDRERLERRRVMSASELFDRHPEISMFGKVCRLIVSG
jgi:hypothetical protein